MFIAHDTELYKDFTHKGSTYFVCMFNIFLLCLFSSSLMSFVPLDNFIFILMSYMHTWFYISIQNVDCLINSRNYKQEKTMFVFLDWPSLLSGIVFSGIIFMWITKLHSLFWLIANRLVILTKEKQSNISVK